MTHATYSIRINPREIGRRYKDSYEDQVKGSWYLSRNLETLRVCEIEYVEWIESWSVTTPPKGILISRWCHIGDIYDKFRSERSHQSTG